jgi:hypothetical protein
MSRYLVNFGDSWANGPGWTDGPGGAPHIENPCYAAQLSRATDRQFVDLSQPSTSAARMVVQFQQFIKEYYQPKQDYVAIFFITAQERQLAFDPAGSARELHPETPGCCNYYKDIYTDHLGEFELNTIILTLQAMSRYYNIDDRYLLGWQQPRLWPEIDISRFYRQGQINAMQLLGGDKITDCAYSGNINFIPNDGHPSVSGHTKIAQALNQWIQKSYL